MENQEWATGPPGLRAYRPPGRRAAGPSRAVGRGPMGLRAAGPLGRGGPWAAGRWAAGLLLAKPHIFSLEIVGANEGALLRERVARACCGSKLPRVYRPLLVNGEPLGVNESINTFLAKC